MIDRRGRGVPIYNQPAASEGGESSHPEHEQIKETGQSAHVCLAVRIVT